MHEPRTTRWGTWDKKAGQLPVEGRQVKELLRGRSISSTCLKITGGDDEEDEGKAGRIPLKRHMDILTWVFIKVIVSCVSPGLDALDPIA
jgi:hypothetical protein